MNLRWIRKKDIKTINDFLNDEVQNNTLDDEAYTYRESKVISNVNSEPISELAYLPFKLERFLFSMILNSLPALHRKKSQTIKKYSNQKICNWSKFLIGPYDRASLNDPNESTLFASFIKKYSPRHWKYIEKSLNANYVNATYTTLSDTNKHYMTSVYSHKEYHFAAYNKGKLFTKFDGLEYKYIFRGYVRYGEKKKDLLNLYNNLILIFPKSKSLKFALFIINFFVKHRCMRAEEEYRFLVIGKEPKGCISINELPNKFSTRSNGDPLKWNSYYKNKPSSIFEEECGNSPANWELEWSADKKCI